MKVLGFLFSISITYFCQGQDWEKISPVEDFSNSIYHLVMPKNSGVIYSFGNEMLVSTDQGSTWLKNNNYSVPVAFDWPIASIPSPNPYVDIEFPAVNNGFISDHESLWKTSDGGNSWQKIQELLPINSGFASSSYIENIQFIDAQTGFAVGPFERIMKTQDGGYTWQLLKSNASTTPYYHLKDVHFFGQQHGIVSGYEIDDIYLNIGIYNHYLLLTIDGGQSWQKINPGPPSDHQESSLYFIDENTGFLLLSNQNYLFPLDLMYKTEDGGLSWQQVNLPAMVARKMYWHNPQVGFVIGGSGFLTGENLVAKTTDGGISWQQVTLSGNNGFLANRCFDILFTDAQNGIVAGTGASLARTVDGGKNWQTVKDVSWPFTAMDFTENTGFALDAAGAIFKTNNGVHWQKNRQSQLFDAHSLTLMNNSSGYFLAQGELYFADNDFQNIIQRTNRNQYQVNAYGKINDKLLVAGHPIGENNTYLGESMDDGLSWKFEKLWDNQMPVKLLGKPDELWMATSSRLWRKRGEGQWEPLFTINAIADVALDDFIITEEGIILIKTVNHTLYRSENDGLDWQQVQGLPQFNSSKFYIHNQQIYLYGSFQNLTGPAGGDLYFSPDDGLTWRQEVLPYFVERQIQAFSCSESHCYLSGGYGLLLRKQLEQPLAVKKPRETAPQISITPNPVDKYLEIRWNHSLPAGNLNVQIRNLQGSLICSLQGKLEYINHQLHEIAGQFRPGIYLVHLNTGEWRATHKFMKH